MTESRRKPKPKVVAGTLGAGLGAGGAVLVAEPAAKGLAALAVDLLGSAGMAISGAGQDGLYWLAYAVVLIFGAALGSFGFGYMKRDR